MQKLIPLLVSLNLLTSPFVLHTSVLAAAQNTQSQRIIVMPFQQIGDAEEFAWLGQSLAENLSLVLSQSDKLAIIERTQLELLLKEQGLGQSLYIDEATAPQIGKLFAAQKIILGSYQIKDQNLMVSTRLVNVNTGQIEPGMSVQLTMPLDQTMELHSALSRQILQKLTGITQQEAQQKIAALSVTDSNYAYQFYWQGIELLGQASDEKHQQALDFLQHAIRIDPEFTLAYAALSEAYSIRAGWSYLMQSSQQDDMDKAIFYAQQALKLGNHPAAVWRALAQAQAAKGNLKEAQQSIEKALKAEPGNTLSIRAWLNYQDLDTFNPTELRLSLAKLGADPEDPVLLESLAQFQLSHLKHLLSETSSQKAHQREIETLTKETQAIYEHLHALRPDNPYHLLKLAEVELIKSNPVKAHEFIDQGLRAEANNFFVHFIAAAILFKQADEQEFVETHLKRAIELNPSFGFAHVFLAMKYMDTQPEMAQQHLLAAQSLTPDSAMTAMFLGIMALQDQQLPQAYAYLQRAYENIGKLRGESVSAGSILNLLVQLSPAIQANDRPKWIQTLLEGGRGISIADQQNLIKLFISEDNLTQAMDGFHVYTQKPGYTLSETDKNIYKKIYLLQELKKSPNQPAILNDLGQLALIENNLQEAESYLNRAISLNPDHLTILFNLALLKNKQQKYSDALTLLQGIIQKQPKHSKARFNLGLTYELLGQRAQAKSIWMSLLADEPQNDDALKALERLSLKN